VRSHVVLLGPENWLPNNADLYYRLLNVRSFVAKISRQKIEDVDHLQKRVLLGDKSGRNKRATDQQPKRLATTINLHFHFRLFKTTKGITC